MYSRLGKGNSVASVRLAQFSSLGKRWPRVLPMMQKAKWFFPLLFLAIVAIASVCRPALAGLPPASVASQAAVDKQAAPQGLPNPASGPIFQNAGSYTVGNGNARISGIAEGDFNGDGIVDLAVAANPNQGGEGSVTIYLGNENGTFQPALASFDSGGLNASAVVTADLNGDGKLDLVVGNFGSLPAQPGNLAIFMGNGNGTFTGGKTYLNTSNVGSVVLGDFNGDGTPDIAVGLTYPSPSLNILLGKGNGTFRAGESLTISSSVFDLTAADINGDGNLDLVLPFDSQGGITVWCLETGMALSGRRFLAGYPRATTESSRRLPWETSTTTESRIPGSRKWSFTAMAEAMVRRGEIGPGQRLFCTAAQ